MRRPSERGFTITEALITLLVFSFFIAVLIVTISYAFRTYSVAVARSDVTTEARRLMLFLEEELRSTAYFSITIEKVQVAGEDRDGVCFTSVLDWSRSDSFNALDNEPDWDRYFVYYTTPERPSGQLVRMVLHPPDPASIGGFPYAPFLSSPSSYMLPDPLGYRGADLSNSRVLASKVKSFEANLIPTTQEVEIKTRLRQNGIMSQRTDRTREGGTFELHYRVHPQNSK